MSIRLRSINSFVTVILVLLAIGTAPVAAETYYFHTDHLGTPQVLTDANQQVVWQGEYSPFGEVTEAVNAVTQNLRFSGQYFDTESGLHYNYFRDYDPSAGRYVESDPIGLRGGLNTYIYAMNTPVIYDDPYGLTTFVCRRPLGGKPGTDEKNGPDVPGNPAYHEYNCVTSPNGVVCQSTNAPPGYGSGLLPKRDPGVPSSPKDDYYDSNACEILEDDANDCIESCLQNIWQQPRPAYAIGPIGTDCQEYSRRTYGRCASSCAGRNRRGLLP